LHQATSITNIATKSTINIAVSEYYTLPTHTDMVVDDHFIKETKENDPEMVTNKVKPKLRTETCQTLLITILSTKSEQNLDKTEFTADSIEKTADLVTLWADKEMISGVICKDNNTKHDDFNEADDWIYLPRTIGKD